MTYRTRPRTKHYGSESVTTITWVNDADDIVSSEETGAVRLLTPWVESPFFEEELANRHDRLTLEEQKLATAFHTQGYVVTKQLVPHALCDRIREETGKELQATGRLPDAWHHGAASARQLATLPALQSLLELLYERRPIPFQTLNFKVGTEQLPHSDSVHFTSFPARFMCGVWVALEDVDEDSGPLFYYPGSHKLPEMTMYDLSLPVDGEWFERYGAYERFQSELMKSQSRTPIPFLANKGDALIWSSNVVHGGSPIRRDGSTRWSQVTHYFFENCIYYQPHSSIVPLGELKLLDIVDLNTLRPVPHRFNGQPVHVNHLPSGRCTLSLRPTSGGGATEPILTFRREFLVLTRRTLEHSELGRHLLQIARSTRTARSRVNLHVSRHPASE